MKLVICALLLLFAVEAHAIKYDKKLHYGLSVPVGMLGMAVMEDCCSEWPWYYKIPAAVGIGLIPGIGKEIMDQINYGGWSNKDLAADALGSLTGAGLYYTVRF